VLLLKKAFFEDDSGSKYRVSVEPVVRVEAGISRTMSFIYEDVASKSLQYIIKGHHDNGTTTDSIYGKGIRIFTVVIVYDSDEKKIMGLIKRFQVRVNYKAVHDFDIDIGDADRK
jgi:hypothetical protein